MVKKKTTKKSAKVTADKKKVSKVSIKQQAVPSHRRSLQRLNKTHKKMAERVAFEGYSSKDLSVEFEYDNTMTDRIMNSPVFKREVKALTLKVEDYRLRHAAGLPPRDVWKDVYTAAIDVWGELNEYAPRALQTLVQIMDSKELPAQHRLTAAMDLLDRAGYVKGGKNMAELSDTRNLTINQQQINIDNMSTEELSSAVLGLLDGGVMISKKDEVKQAIDEKLGEDIIDAEIRDSQTKDGDSE